MPFIDEIANGLADEVVRNGKTSELVFREDFPKLLPVLRGGGRRINIEVVAPAGEFESLVAHLAGNRSEFCNR